MDNRSKALAYLKYVAENRMSEAFALTTSDCELMMPDGRVLTRLELCEMLNCDRAQFAGPIDQTVFGITAEGDRVAVEVSSTVPLLNGSTYSNEHHFAFVFRGGRICRVSEYCDLTRTAVFLE